MKVNKLKITRDVSLWIVLLIVIPLLVNCSEEKNGPLSSYEIVPENITITEVISIPGGAEIHYQLPPDPNLSYVEAELITPEGKVLIFSASSYSSRIIIDGLSSEVPHEVSLYSISSSGIRSDAQVCTIEPLQIPIHAVFNTVTIEPSFNSVKVNYENVTGAFFTYYLCYFDDKEMLVDYASFSSKNINVKSHTFYGLPSEERKYGIYMVDKWNNYSDTVWQVLTPMVEEEIPKAQWTQLMLANDGPFYGNEEPLIKLEFLWDGHWGRSWDDPWDLNSKGYEYRVFQFDGNPNEQHSFTINLGKKYVITRVRINHQRRYEWTMMKQCEIWGSSEIPPSDGNWEWEGWVKIADMEAFKPSGIIDSGFINIGEGDKEAWERGAISSSLTESPIQFLRLRSVSDWKGTTTFAASELTLFGAESE